MPLYRIYLLDGRGHFQRREELEATDDQDAYARAHTMSAGRDWELWQGTKLLAKVVKCKAGLAGIA